MIKTKLKQIITKYFDSTWIPFVCLITTLIMTIISCVVFSGQMLSKALFAVNRLFLIGIIFASIWNLVKKRWKKGFINLCLLIILLIIYFFVGIWGLLNSPSEDGFGKDIVIPPTLKMEEPRDKYVKKATRPIDEEGEALIATFSQNDEWNQKSAVNTNVDIPDFSSIEKKRVLIRHLATSAKWYLSREKDKLYAYRRFAPYDLDGYSIWENGSHGYYSATNFAKKLYNSDTFNYYQFRIVLRLGDSISENKSWISSLFPYKYEQLPTYTKTNMGKVALNTNESANHANQSVLMLESSGFVIEIYEDAKTKHRVFTSLTLSMIEKELNALTNSAQVKEKGFDIDLMPKESIKYGVPEITLCGNSGIYFVQAYVNPGQPGYVYLKVFEETRNIPLSTNRIPVRSTEYIGWSDNPQQQFFYNTEITVYEGDWGTYYPGRFELWFVPESSSPEIKLIEKVFKIEGWQR